MFQILLTLCFSFICAAAAQAQVAVSISPTSATVPTNTTKQFAATVTGTTNTGVKWYVDGVLGGASSTGTITTSGLYTAPSTTGSHTVTIVSNADPTKSASSAVTVTVVAVSISPTSVSIPKNTSKQFVATVTGTTNTGVKWYVDNVLGGSSSSGTITTGGYYTAPASAGPHTVKVVSNADPTKSATSAVTVNDLIVGISISPTSATLAANATQQFAATITNTSNLGRSWLVDGVVGGNSTVGTITTGGLYTAPGTSGSHTVKVISDADKTKSASAAVTVTGGTTVAVSVSPTSASVPVNTTKQFTATVTGTANTAVTWSVDNVNGGNSTVGTISAGGLYTAPASTGSHTVKATSNADSSKSASAAVTVTSQSGVSVSISPRATSVTFTQPMQFTATVSGASSTSVTWAVDGIGGGNATVGTIDSAGLYHPPSSTGVHTIKATASADTTKSATAQLTVTNHPGVFTYHYDNARTGQNTNETVLTKTNVNSGQFGQLFSYPTDGFVIGQPLYVANLNIPGKGYHNVLYVATEHDSVYAYDADGRTTQPLWQVSFIDLANGITTVPVAEVGGKTPGNEVGITSTPVIDTSTNTMYVLAQTKENGRYPQRLHALDITTGQEKFGGPVEITATVKGIGDGTDGSGNVPFDPLWQYQRAALLLSKGLVYIAWASHYDETPYHGWVMAYDASNLAQRGVYNSSPNDTMGGIWLSGAGPSADSTGAVYVTTGNGTFDTGAKAYGDSVLKLNLGRHGLKITDWFTPFNASTLESVDWDLGSGAPLLLPDEVGSATHPHLMVVAGKESRIYLLDRDNLGHFNSAGDTQIVQSIPGQLGTSKLITSPAYWNHNVYFLCWNDVLKAFSINNASLSSTPVAQSATAFGFPGAPPSVSSNGTNNGIVWVFQRGTGTLQAFDATNVATNLYLSPGLGTQVSFATPVVVNGKVYVGMTNQVVGWGLLP